MPVGRFGEFNLTRASKNRDTKRKKRKKKKAGKKFGVNKKRKRNR